MPFLFAFTMFVSATLLFLVQPMIGKMMAPLLGGTPAVWNTCMVFFQALLLGGYFYAHKLTSTFDLRKQIRIHTIVLMLPLVALLSSFAMTETNNPIPILKSLAPQGDDYPFFGVLAILLVAIGLPFFVVSTSAPLLQKWFGESGHPSARDPYFLYGASNFGSLLALVAYPILVEPNFRVIDQTRIWSCLYAILVGFTIYCGRSVWNAPPPRPVKLNDPLTKRGKATPVTISTAPVSMLNAETPSIWERLRWVGLAFVPSSLMLGVTTYMSTDIASLPLLWVIPLALYLITFILAFSTLPKVLHLIVVLLAPVAVLLVIFLNTSGTKPSFEITIAMHNLAFFLVAWACHSELARSRPSTKYLTNFYLTMSFGGMLGGMFNGLIAPVIFNFVSEYPLTMVAACLLIPKLPLADREVDDPRGARIFDFLWPMFVFGVAALLINFQQPIASVFTSTAKAFGVRVFTISTILTYGVPLMIAYVFIERPLRFGLCVAAVLLANFVHTLSGENEAVLYYGRSYFGTLKIERTSVSYKISEAQYVDNQFDLKTKDEDGDPVYKRLQHDTRLVHGTTLHGRQLEYAEFWSTVGALTPMMSQNPLEAAQAMALGAWTDWQYTGRDPWTYYHRTGPVGSMFEAFWLKNEAKRAAGVMPNTEAACIGLGTGSLSSYGLPGQKMTFFEIDTHVRKLVEPDWDYVKKHRRGEGIDQPVPFFTYIDSARKQGVEIEFIMGDARISLERLPKEQKFGIMLIDAFSSDAIPVHLLTKEAVQLYFDHLEDDGLLALHISNRYLDLEPVCLRIAEALGVERVMHDDDGVAYGKTASTWIALAKTKEALGILETGKPNGAGKVVSTWGKLDDNPKVALWTDDFSPIKHILRWKFNFGFGD